MLIALVIIATATAFAFKAGLLATALPLFAIFSAWNLGLQLYNEAIFKSINNFNKAPQHKPKERLTIVSVQKK